MCLHIETHVTRPVTICPTSSTTLNRHSRFNLQPVCLRSRACTSTQKQGWQLVPNASNDVQLRGSECTEQSHSHTHRVTHTFANTHESRTHSHTHTQTESRAQSHTHSHSQRHEHHTSYLLTRSTCHCLLSTHMHMHTHTQVHTHTHTHTHPKPCKPLAETDSSHTVRCH